jgi:[ribosomal protein S18]-alanine N-acetyltransferase
MMSAQVLTHSSQIKKLHLALAAERASVGLPIGLRTYGSGHSGMVSPIIRRTMKFIFRPLDQVSVRAFIAWRYDKPYDVYNIIVSDEETENLVGFYTDPATCAYAIDDERGDLLAFCSFGEDAKVSGADYNADALDIGMGVRPDLIGQGLGGSFASAVIDFAQRTFAPQVLRVTVAEFNARAQRVWMKLGFQPVQTFVSTGNGMIFVVMTRHVRRDAL